MADPSIRSGHPGFFPRHWAFPTEDALQEALDWWCAQLGLSDWAIDVQRKRACEMPEAYARVHWTLPHRRATISMIRASDVTATADPMDEEQTLVHELVHVCLAALDDSTDMAAGTDQYSLCVEQPVDRLAFALVNLRRGKAGAHVFTFEDPGMMVRLKDGIMDAIRRGDGG